jgi:hypothetical protein
MAGSAKNFTPGAAPRQPRYRFELLIAPGMRSSLPASILGWDLAVNGVHATGNDGRDDDDPYGEERERREGGGAERAGHYQPAKERNGAENDGRLSQ